MKDGKPLRRPLTVEELKEIGRMPKMPTEQACRIIEDRVRNYCEKIGRYPELMDGEPTELKVE